MKIQYQSKCYLQKLTKVRIEQADSILTEYLNEGLAVTVRQLYYQFVSRNWIENSPLAYKAIVNAVNTGRLLGMLDWEGIEDRTRGLDKMADWIDPEDIVATCASQYKEDLWRNQKCYVEVWVEKEALAGVIERACQTHRVPFFSCRGYNSQSESWRAANRFKDQERPCHVIHLGDHDPSGIDMTRDIIDRMAVFGVENVSVNRIALTMAQVKEYNPPPNFAKKKDSRFDEYVSNYGTSSWELDALDLRIVDNLIRSTVESHLDLEQWEKDKEKERKNKESLRMISDDYESVVQFLELTRQNGVEE